MRTGILGGTFDPPHIGHLLIAEESRSRLELDLVLFIPARQPPHKLNHPVTAFEHRLNMLRLALDSNPFFTLSLVEAERPGPSYTVDTLRELREKSSAGDELYFIMGSDSLVELPTWHEPQELIRLCYLAVLRRPGFEPDLKALEEIIPGLTSRVVFIPAPPFEISSTEIHTRCEEGADIRYLVPNGVAGYIDEHGLYRGEKP